MTKKEKLNLTLDLIEKFDVPVPRYTSYPMVPHWKDTYGNQDHIKHLVSISIYHFVTVIVFSVVAMLK